MLLVNRLEADHDIAMACNGTARQTDVGAIHVHQFAVGGIAGARDVDEDAADLRCCPRGGGDLIDIVELSPLTSQDCRIYNMPILNAWDSITEPKEPAFVNAICAALAMSMIASARALHGTAGDDDDRQGNEAGAGDCTGLSTLKNFQVG